MKYLKMFEEFKPDRAMYGIIFNQILIQPLIELN